MSDVYEGWGDAQGSPISPTRPPSVRKRQSMHIMDLEARLDQLAAENNALQEAKATAERSGAFLQDNQTHAIAEAVAARDEEVRAKDEEIARVRTLLESLQAEVARLTDVNETLKQQNANLAADTNNRYATLQEEVEHAQEQWRESRQDAEHARKQWTDSTRELEQLRQQHDELSGGMEQIVRDEIANALRDKNEEIGRLSQELEEAMDQIRTLQEQIRTQNQGDDFLTFRDEDYFDTACQQLCQHVQQWVMRFSKFSDSRACRLSTEISNPKIEERLDNAILDGTDVDLLLEDRKKRRDVFMSVVMRMIWEYVFTRYLFGMDREQRQKLKALEKTLTEVGPVRAVAQWRAITLTLLSRREAFLAQRAQDTEAVVQEIFGTLEALLPPPAHLRGQALDSLRKVVGLAVDLSIEMRAQRAEYIMLPPLEPEYDARTGDLVRKVHFNAALMNERSGETSSNEELEARGAVVKVVLFPLVVKKGDDLGEGEDEIVVCPAQVLVARPQSKKVVRVMSGAMDMDAGAGSARRSASSVAPEGMDVDEEEE
ncbi:hypothetical protein BDY21DRAFT_344559 [Lineolata rhizophorae]|uniref:Uncharacterized protein n=1 Tax=Lineolata rhizophorae TaxID=578093 RepID=A0A6A6P107_9PEZI|nr:hypothetical protein BDY21DRAFT_344559 [Lineolata rhizophorae]